MRSEIEKANHDFGVLACVEKDFELTLFRLNKSSTG